MNNLQAIHLEIFPNHDLNLLRETFASGRLPKLESIGLTTSCFEEDIYPAVAIGCPNLRVLYLSSSNPIIELGVLKDMLGRFDKLEIVIINMDFEDCDHDVSDLFGYRDKRFRKLEYVGFDFSMRHRFYLTLFRQE
jgi:hypothetical protein